MPGSSPESRVPRCQTSQSLKEVILNNSWFADSLGNVIDAMLLVLGIEGMEIKPVLVITRLVVYVVQLVSTLLLQGRPRYKSTDFFVQKDPATFSRVF